MEKIKSWVPLVAFVAFLMKIMITSPSFPDAVVLGALISYVILEQTRLKDKKFEETAQKMKNLEDINKKFQDDIKNLQTSVSSMKMSTGLRPVPNKVAPDKGF
jgi:hypothetical protein